MSASYFFTFPLTLTNCNIYLSDVSAQESVKSGRAEWNPWLIKKWQIKKGEQQKKAWTENVCIKNRRPKKVKS